MAARPSHLKFGGSWNYYRAESYYPGNNGQNGFISYTNFNFTGQAIGDFLLDQVSRKGKGSTSDAWTHLQHRVAFYGADDFKITNSLTLNLGLRWAYTSPWVEKGNRQANFDLTNAAQLLAGQNGNSRALYDSFYNGWEPRIGFAYRMGDRWVFRGGYAISQYMEGTGANQRLPLNPPFFFESQVDYDRTTGAGTIATGFQGLQPLDKVSGQLRAWDAKIRPQFTQQGNLFVEYLLGPRSSINVGYVGSNSTDVINTIDANQPLPGTGPANTWLPTQQRRPLYRYKPGYHVPHHDDLERVPQHLQRAADDVQATAVAGRGLHGQLHAEQCDVERPRVFWLGGALLRGRRRPRRSTAAISRPTTGRRTSTRGTSPRWPAAGAAVRGASGRSATTGIERSTRWRAAGRSATRSRRTTGYPITVLDSSNPSLQASRSTSVRTGSAVARSTTRRWNAGSIEARSSRRHSASSGIRASASSARRATGTSISRSASASRQWANSPCCFRAELFNALNHSNFGPPQANIQSTAFGTITSTVGDCADCAVGGEILLLVG
jgi:hypothetical protein